VKSRSQEKAEQQGLVSQVSPALPHAAVVVVVEVVVVDVVVGVVVVVSDPGVHTPPTQKLSLAQIPRFSRQLAPSARKISWQKLSPPVIPGTPTQRTLAPLRPGQQSPTIPVSLDLHKPLTASIHPDLGWVQTSPRQIRGEAQVPTSPVPLLKQVSPSGRFSPLQTELLSLMEVQV